MSAALALIFFCEGNFLLRVAALGSLSEFVERIEGTAPDNAPAMQSEKHRS